MKKATLSALALLLVCYTADCRTRPIQHSAERRLFERIVSRYDRTSRPVFKASTPVSLNFSIALHQIIDVVEKNQTLLTKEWFDELSTWSPADFGNLKYIVMPTWALWLPDLYIFNNAEKGGVGFVQVNDSRVLVHHNGRIEWSVPMIVKSSCAMDVLYFPFDNQRCFIRIGSWVYDVDQLDIVLKEREVNMEMFLTHNEFDLINATLKRDLLSYDVWTGQFPQITVHLHIRRKPLYYAYTVIAPTIVLCILTYSSFFLPCDSGAKVGIGLTVFLSLHVLQLACAENIPESNNLPLLGLFLTLVMTLNCISLLFATFVINMKKKGDKKGSPEVNPILLKYVLGKLTCTRRLGFFDFYDVCDEDLSQAGSFDDVRITDLSDESTPNIPVLPGLTVANRRITSLQSGGETSQVLRSHFGGHDYSSVTQSAEGQSRDLRLEWYFVAEVLDKTLMFIFFVGMVLTIVVSLILIPWIYHDFSGDVSEDQGMFLINQNAANA